MLSQKSEITEPRKSPCVKILEKTDDACLLVVSSMCIYTHTCIMPIQFYIYRKSVSTMLSDWSTDFKFPWVALPYFSIGSK